MVSLPGRSRAPATEYPTTARATTTTTPAQRPSRRRRRGGGVRAPGLWPDSATVVRPSAPGSACTDLPRGGIAVLFIWRHPLDVRWLRGGWLAGRLSLIGRAASRAGRAAPVRRVAGAVDQPASTSCWIRLLTVLEARPDHARAPAAAAVGARRRGRVLPRADSRDPRQHRHRAHERVAHRHRRAADRRNGRLLRHRTVPGRGLGGSSASLSTPCGDWAARLGAHAASGATGRSACAVPYAERATGTARLPDHLPGQVRPRLPQDPPERKPTDGAVRRSTVHLRARGGLRRHPVGVAAAPGVHPRRALADGQSIFVRPRQWAFSRAGLAEALVALGRAGGRGAGPFPSRVRHTGRRKPT